MTSLAERSLEAIRAASSRADEKQISVAVKRHPFRTHSVLSIMTQCRATVGKAKGAFVR
jgi:hypothetical protein